MALGSMVCNLTTGKKKYAQYEEDIQAILGKAKTLQDQLLEMIDKMQKDFSHFLKLTVYQLILMKKKLLKK